MQRWREGRLSKSFKVKISATKYYRSQVQMSHRCVFISPANSVSESLEESAAAYTKATAKKCILEKVDVKTGEESESNVLQVRGGVSAFNKKRDRKQ